MNADLYSSLLNRYKTGCVFCDPEPMLTVESSKNFAVTFDVAPLTPGHLILHSREHHSCAGEVPVDQFAELNAMRDYAKSLVRAAYGTVTIYEHGRVGHCLTDGVEHRLCHHFHLHLVPGDSDVSSDLASRFTRLTPARYEEISRLYLDHGDYLYLESDAGEMSYFVVDHEIERHLLRTLISRHKGVPERADWRAATDSVSLVAGMENIRSVLTGISVPVELEVG